MFSEVVIKYGGFVGGGLGGWWSSTAVSMNSAWNRSIYYSAQYMHRNSYGKGDGFSVRCIKNK
jgi:uncharacterized protein (TIGR02145 family)